MSEPEFPYSQFGPEPFHLRRRIDTIYHLLKLKFNDLDDTDDFTFDGIIDDVADGIRQNQINARFLEEWFRFPALEVPSSFNAFRIAVAFWLEAHYAEKAGDGPQSTAALFSAYFYLGMFEAPITVTEVAAKGGKVISDIYRPLAQAAIASADKLVTQGHKRAHRGLPLNVKGIIPLIANDPAVIKANKSLDKKALPVLMSTLTRWTRTDDGGRPPFREAYHRVIHAWKAFRDAGASRSKS